MSWSDERIAAASRLWIDGNSAAVIAGELGVSRNAVIGISNRKRALFPRRRTVTTARKAPPEAAPKPTSQPVPKISRPPEVVAPAEPPRRTDAFRPLAGRAPVLLADAQPCGCRWPVEPDNARDPLHSVTLHVCGAPKPEDSGPHWCAAHREIGKAVRA
ncbi:GcrA family cell cycle regulator [Aurantimonas sp. A2-1-M11]|uniref:GcrA family cell cycle regulator n=1 Tax=Aurantimonas sp. A2-1-M11 TaxID=3113712 RepID=UPI002F94E60E